MITGNSGLQVVTIRTKTEPQNSWDWLGLGLGDVLTPVFDTVWKMRAIYPGFSAVQCSDTRLSHPFKFHNTTCIQIKLKHKQKLIHHQM